MKHRTVVLALAPILAMGAALALAVPTAEARRCKTDANCRHGYVCKAIPLPDRQPQYGTCVRRRTIGVATGPVSEPKMCPMIYQPVCGADGKTYPNTCHAEQAGVRVKSHGACAER